MGHFRELVTQCPWVSLMYTRGIWGDKLHETRIMKNLIAEMGNSRLEDKTEKISQKVGGVGGKEKMKK